MALCLMLIVANIDGLINNLGIDLILSDYLSNNIDKITRIASNPWFLFFTGFLTATLFLSWLFTNTSLLKNKTKYIETSLKVRRESLNQDFEHDSQKNIFSWKQHKVQISHKDTAGNSHTIITTSFFIVFDKPIKYGWPQLDTFEHDFPSYQWFGENERTIILCVEGEIKAPIFELIFPPPHKDEK